ncbi:hypothetical protein [Microcoleus sp. N3A4]|uniref:hypothetical protein n=1 Tax=Microcoleus sp. N3A4 TaxID=3055379 RepID=UPI002FD1095B
MSAKFKGSGSFQEKIAMTTNFKGGTRHAIYPWNQSKIENPQAPAFIRGVASKI